jgi:hypothetical protein
MKYRLLISFFSYLVFCSVTITSGQNSNEYQQWLKQRQSEFDHFRSEQDKAFADFLRSGWIEVSLDQQSSPMEDKLPEIPVVEPDNDDQAGDVQSPEPAPIDFDDKPTVQFEPDTINPDETIRRNLQDLQCSSAAGTSESVDISMLGLWLTVPTRPHYTQGMTGSINADAVADRWLYLSDGPYAVITDCIQYYAQELHWNDWAMALFIRDYAFSQVSDHNSRASLTWFLLVRMGLEAQVGYARDTLYLMIASDHMLYSVPRFRGEPGMASYFVTPQMNGSPVTNRSLHTYRAGQISGLKPFELQSDVKPLGIADVVARDFNFMWKSDSLTIRLEFDRNYVRFMEGYPQTEPDIIFNVTASSVFRESAIRAFKPVLEGMAVDEALNFLLRFVQTSFDYKTDTEQFGRQRFMVPDELLHYPYSDCDDRAIMFAWLVRNLLDIPVIGLEYPGHIATAVQFESPIGGKRITFNGLNWLVSDPTYIFADIGMAMPSFVNVTPRVIPVASNL